LINGGLLASSTNNHGGDIEIQSTDFTLTRGGTIATSATTGTAGNITIGASRLDLSQGLILATSVQDAGGNITLRGQERISLSHQSLISTATGALESGGGNGGNISLTAPLLVALPGQNNDITANAFQGNGGQIQLRGQGIYGFTFGNITTPQSDPRNNVSASSRFGVSGSTQVSQEVSANPRDLRLAETFKALSPIVLDLCKATQGNSFILSGLYKIPPSNRQIPFPVALWQDDRPTSILNSTLPPVNQSPVNQSPANPLQPNSPEDLLNHAPASMVPSAPLREALTWHRSSNGSIVLTHVLNSPNGLYPEGQSPQSREDFPCRSS
jgi:hypothetical protein